MGKYWVGLSEVGFFDRLLDSDLRQRRDINAALDEEAAIADNVTTLRANLDQLHRMVFEMQVMNGVLLKMLSEAGQLDLKILKYRFEAELETIADAKARPDPVEAAPPAGALQVTCPRCNMVVLASRTTMIETGLVCDGCLR